MPITIRQIRYFMAAAENGKVAVAASVVGISASAITNAIQELEEHLGVVLFDRHRRGLELTFEGHRFLQHCHHIMAAVSAATHAVTQAHINFEGVIRLGVTTTVAGYFLAPLLARFSRSFPNIGVQCYQGERPEIEQKLVDDALDIGIILVSNMQNKRELTHHTLIKSKRRLWVTPGHELSKISPVTLQDIAQYPYVQLMIDEATKSHMRFWQKARCHPNVIFETDSIEAMRSFVAAGIGVTILSDLVYRPWSLEGERIDAIILKDEIPTMDVGLIWSKRKSLNIIETQFLEFSKLFY